MRKNLLLLGLFAAFCSQVAAQSWHTNLSLGQNRTELNIKTTENQDFEGFLQLSSLAAVEVQTSAGAFVQLGDEGFISSKEYGKPALPEATRLLEIPAGSEWTITITSYDVQDINLTANGFPSKIIPAQPSLSKSEDPSAVPFRYDAAFYSLDQFNTSELVSVEQLGTMRGVQLGRLTIRPIQYNPATNTLRVYNNIQFHVSFNGETGSIQDGLYSPYYQQLFGRLINHQPSTKALIETAPAKFVIVSARMFETQLQPFIAWKKKKGFQVIEAYTDQPAVGTTTTSIKAYLKNLYTSASATNPAPSFVLFVGDIAQIPVFSGTSGSHYTDLYYFTYDAGTDIYPEIFYGRFSANTTAQLQPQLDKTLEYEQFLFDDASFLDDVVLIAGVDASYAPTYGNGQLNYGTSNYFNAAHGLNSYTYLYPASQSSGAVIKQNVSNGVSFANYTAHCSEAGWADPSFVISDVANLQNENKYPLMVGNCCLSAKFDVAECFGEALLRAEKKGALGYIGGTNNTYWNEDYWFGVGSGTVSANPSYAGTGLGFYDRLFHDHGEPESAWFVTNGQIVQAGNMAVTQAAGSETYYWEIYHLLGDPSVTIYLGIPPVVSCTHPSGMPVGSGSCTIQTEENAYVALSVDTTLLAAGIADATGVLTLTFTPLSTMTPVNVIATKQNRAPYISTMSVFSANNPFVIGNSLTVHDATGNNNGYADYNEQLNLHVQVNNLGMLGATDLTAVLSSNDPAVTILNNTVAIGSMSSQQVLDVLDAFEVKISNEVPDMHQVLFTLTITDGAANSWQSYLSVTIYAPNLAITQVLLDDSSTGNGNGKLESGEVAEISFSVVNQGHAQLQNATGTVNTINSNIQLFTAPTAIATLDINQTEQISGLVQILSASGNATLILSVDAGYYSCSTSIIKKIGQVSEDWESQGFTTFSWANSSAIPWLINNSGTGNTTFSARSGDIAASQSTILSLTSEAAAADSIKFDLYVSCEEMGYSYYDYLDFTIDNVSKGKWAGQVSWTTVGFPVTQGSHTYKWTYKKDSYMDEGEDLSRIDNILLPLTPQVLANHAPQVTSSPDTLVLVGESYSYTFEATDADGNALTLNQSGLPTFLSYTDNGNNTASLTGTATSADKGIYPIVLSAWDGIAFGSQVYYLYVMPNAGISELNENLFFVSPNPARNTISISLTNPVNGKNTIKIYNQLGELVKSLPMNSTTIQIDIQDLPAGIYQIDYQSDKYSSTQKFIKQ